MTVFDELVASSSSSVLFQIITLSRAVTNTDRVKQLQTLVFNTAVYRKHPSIFSHMLGKAHMLGKGSMTHLLYSQLSFARQ